MSGRWPRGRPRAPYPGNMAAARPDVADLLDVRIPTGGRVVAVSDLHLPPERSDISGRSCALVAARLAELAGTAA